MVDPSGFDRVFEKEIPKHDTHRQAFRKLNREYEEVIGKKRYKNYESYRHSRRQRVKK